MKQESQNLFPRGSLQEVLSETYRIGVDGILFYCSYRDLAAAQLEKKYSSNLEQLKKDLQKAKELKGKEERGEPINLFEPFPIAVDVSSADYKEIIKTEIRDIVEKLSKGHNLKQIEDKAEGKVIFIDNNFTIRLTPDSNLIKYALKFKGKEITQEVLKKFQDLHKIICLREQTETEKIIGNDWDLVEVIDYTVGDGRDET